MKRLTNLLFLLLFSLNAVTIQAQFTEKHRQTVEFFVKIINEKHLLEFDYNNQFEKKLKKNLLTGLDPNKIIMNQKDAEILDSIPLNINYIYYETKFLNRLMPFFNQYKKKLEQTDSLLSEERFLHETPDSLSPISFFKPPAGFAENETIRKKRLKEYIYNYAVFIKTSEADSSKKTTLRASVQDVAKQLRCKIKVGLENKVAENFYTDKLLNAYALSCDPHSSFLSLSDMDIMKNMLSDTDLSFGFNFETQRDGSIAVGELKPGGPAWKSKKVDEGDVLLDILHEGKSVTGNCFDMFLLFDILYSPDYTELRFKLKKKTGKKYTVKLSKEKLSNSDNTIDGYIISNKKYKLGYLRLPSFYTSESDTSVGGCTADITKELLKLKAEGIDALVFDLRDNTGGSVLEAINSVGLFIDYGVVSLDLSREKYTYLKDPQRGSVFDKPLLVMVNERSASASEMFAAAMQDYKRAVIFGRKTFGKGTAQIALPVTEKPEELRIIDITRGLPGYAYVTTDKMFRITGQTHQINGVKPDIELPAVNNLFIRKEKDFETAVSASRANKKVYYTPGKELPITYLNEHFKSRTLDLAKAVDSLTTLWEKIEKQYKSRISLDNYHTVAEKYLDFSQKAHKVYYHEQKEFEVKGSKSMQDISKLSSIKAEHYQDHIEILRTDRAIFEAGMILIDLIKYYEEN